MLKRCAHSSLRSSNQESAHPEEVFIIIGDLNHLNQPKLTPVLPKYWQNIVPCVYCPILHPSPPSAIRPHPPVPAACIHSAQTEDDVSENCEVRSEGAETIIRTVLNVLTERVTEKKLLSALTSILRSMHQQSLVSSDDVLMMSWLKPEAMEVQKSTPSFRPEIRHIKLGIETDYVLNIFDLRHRA